MAGIALIQAGRMYEKFMKNLVKGPVPALFSVSH